MPIHFITLLDPLKCTNILDTTDDTLSIQHLTGKTPGDTSLSVQNKLWNTHNGTVAQILQCTSPTSHNGPVLHYTMHHFDISVT